ncbi:MAG: flavodoxin family protein [Rhodocyclaceae bacterium]|nr:flavodoxin family protein [Rhodocyclaceae bacterium]
MGRPDIVAVVGSYRAGGVTERLVEATLAAARAAGAKTEIVRLRDLDMRHCANCRLCMQQPGEARGECVIDDAVPALLSRLDRADAMVLAAPVNLGNVTAVTRILMERCAGAAWWPWDSPAPRLRRPKPRRPAVLISSSAAPAWMARWFAGAASALDQLATMLGFRPLGMVWQGLVNRDPMPLSPGVVRRAERLGRRLARVG